MTDFVLPEIFLVLRTKLSVLVLTSSSANKIKGLQGTRTNNHVLLPRPPEVPQVPLRGHLVPASGRETPGPRLLTSSVHHWRRQRRPGVRQRAFSALLDSESYWEGGSP